MGLSKEDFAEKFLRTYSKPFTTKEMRKVLTTIGISSTLDDARDFLYTSPNVIVIGDDLFITHAGAFTGELFSILPTAAEFEQGVLVPGDRCMPFAEIERISSSLRFYYNGRKIPPKVGKFDSDDAIDMFMFFGEEYAPQYISADPANHDLDLAGREFELPNSVYLTGIDLGFLAKRAGYIKGDRILCCVSDWDAGKINVMVVHSGANVFDKGEDGEKRLEWFSVLEKAFLDSFDNKGPLGSIADQLVDVFFDNRTKLCVPHCGSVEELFLSPSMFKKVGFQHYGVETRIWKKGEDVPAFGKWNSINAELNSEIKKHIPLSEYAINSIPDYVYDELIFNFLYTKEKDLVKFVSDFICQGEFELDDKKAAQVALSFKERYNALSRGYNWFADQKIGAVRKKALELYGKVSALVRKIDFLGESAMSFPSQELVILAQLNTHLLKMIETVAFDPSAEENADSLLLSLDGMDWNFEDIRGVLEDSIEKERMRRFKIINVKHKETKTKLDSLN